VVICPSNPLISIAPILAVPGIREALRACLAPVIAVSPIVGGRAVKGPTAKMMAELGLTPSAAEVARLYAEFLDAFVYDVADPVPPPQGLRMEAAQTVMTTLDDRDSLARAVLNLADDVRAGRSPAEAKRARG
jgi:LPPG:FO 2-phospho-L-lactate transferase